MTGDFETLPAGTAARLVALESYARKASIELARMAGGGSELFTRIGDDFFADPVLCAARVESKLMNARRRYRGPGRG